MVEGYVIGEQPDCPKCSLRRIVFEGVITAMEERMVKVEADIEKKYLDLKEDAAEVMRRQADLVAENKRLRSDRDVLVKARDKWREDCGVWQVDNDRLRGELDQMRINCAKCAAMHLGPGKKGGCK